MSHTEVSSDAAPTTHSTHQSKTGLFRRGTRHNKNAGPRAATPLADVALATEEATVLSSSLKLAPIAPEQREAVERLILDQIRSTTGYLDPEEGTRLHAVANDMVDAGKLRKVQRTLQLTRFMSERWLKNQGHAKEERTVYVLATQEC